jgi:hypothetical protein
MTEYDPEKCSYVPLPADLERLVRQRFVAEFERTVERLDPPPETPGLRSIGLESVSTSIEYDQDGDRWLRLLATDSTRWYVAWGGDSAEAITLGGQFGETIAESFAL